MIRSFRKSKRSSSSSTSPKNNISRVSSSSIDTTPDSRLSSFDLALQSPKKVIRALYDYNPQGPGELGFKKGDFFHVLKGEDIEEGSDSEGWYEATNPMTGIKGMVPVTYFESFNRSRPHIINGAQDASPERNEGKLSSTNISPRASSFSRSSSNGVQSLYAVTLYDFKAERPDELDITVGENLIICAHHNYEWFIAKPINRLGGPGLVPVSYVKIIDLVKINSVTPKTEDESDIVKIIDGYSIPTVEQWKDQTAKYQASSIPLGMISDHTGDQSSQPLSSNSQYFKSNGFGSGESNRSSLLSSNVQILEASVESYSLDKGRYQYLIVAKLNNGKIRYLTRYYQDFYDLQVKLLELFPYEAGKIENSKRIIPSIPGPLINVNDSISKLRREKLDYYLRNLIALPSNISRSDEVLALFDVLDNGYDKEVIDQNQSKKEKRGSKSVSQKSYYHQDRLSQYSNVHNNLANGNGNKNISPTDSNESANLHRSLSSSSTNLLLNTVNSSSATNSNGATINSSSAEIKQEKVKVKFYYEDDIFVLLLPTNLRLEDLKSKLSKRLISDNNVDLDNSDRIRLYPKNDYDDFTEQVNSESLNEIQLELLKSFEIDDDEKFKNYLHEKCKLVIVI